MGSLSLGEEGETDGRSPTDCTNQARVVLPTKRVLCCRYSVRNQPTVWKRTLPVRFERHLARLTHVCTMKGSGVRCGCVHCVVTFYFVFIYSFFLGHSASMGIQLNRCRCRIEFAMAELSAAFSFGCVFNAELLRLRLKLMNVLPPFLFSPALCFVLASN